MKTFILIHGAWLNAGIWDRIALRLRDAGHEVLTPESAGQRSGRDTGRSTSAFRLTSMTIGALVSEARERDPRRP